MATYSADTLYDRAKCLGCASNASMADMLKLALLDLIASNECGGGASVESFFQSGDYGGGDPTFTPDGGIGIGIDTSTDPDTIHWYYDGAWHA